MSNMCTFFVFDARFQSKKFTFETLFSDAIFSKNLSTFLDK